MALRRRERVGEPLLEQRGVGAARMQKASASASRVVVVENVSEPVSSWMPSANTVASKGVTAMPRSAMMCTSSVTSEPSPELTSASASM